MELTTIATTPSGWKATMFFAGKAREWVIGDKKEHKKGATSAVTEITQNKEFAKNSINNYSTVFDSKEAVISCI